MSELQKQMISQARRQYHQIFPCATKGSLRECFTVEENRILFWFNTADETTHVLAEELA